MKTPVTAALCTFSALALAVPHAEARTWLRLANHAPATPVITEPAPEPKPAQPPAGITLKTSPIQTPRPDSYIRVDTLLPSPDSASVAYRQRFGFELSLDGIARDNQNLISIDNCTDPAFSPDSKSIAFVFQERDWTLWHNKKLLEGFDPVTPVSFSPDGKRLYYLARQGKQRFVVEANQPHPQADLVDYDSRAFTPDASVLAYPARFGTQWCMVINGDPGPAWDRIVSQPVTAQQGPHVYYVAFRDGRYTVCDRHTPGPGFALIENPPAVSADGQTFAYWARGDDMRWQVYKNHQPVPGYSAQRPGQLVLSDDGKTLAAILKRNDAWAVVVNGTPGPAFAAIGDNSLTLSPEADRVAYAVRRQAGWAVVLDDQVQPTHTQLAANSLKFSPDGKRLAYIALKKGRWNVIEDGFTHPSFNQIQTHTLAFSPDSKHLAYTALNAGRPTVVLNAKPLGEYESASQLKFSPDAEHLLYVAKHNGASHIYVDGQPLGEPFDLLVPGATLHFKSDTKCQTVAIRRDGDQQTTTLWRYELNLDAPAPKHPQNNGTPDPADTPDTPEPETQPDPSFVDVPTN